MKEYVLKLSEVEKRKLTASYDARFQEFQMFVDGKPLSTNKSRQYFLEDDNGGEIVFEWRAAENGALFITANGVPIELQPRLKWFDWVWCCAPLLLVFGGGFIGGALGGAVTCANVKIMGALRSRFLAYLVTFSLSVAAFAIYLVAAVGLSVAFGTKEGKQIQGILKAAAESASGVSDSREKPEGTPNLYADNGTSATLRLAINGVAAGEIPPYRFLPLRVKPGKHKFVFSEGEKPFDSIEGEIPKGKAAVINPKGAAGYVIVSTSYALNNFGGFGGGFGYRDVTGQNFLTADFGLLETLPEKIEVKVGAHEIGKTFARDKIAKPIPNNLDSRQAASILKNYLDKSNQAFSFADKDGALVVLLSALGKEPKDPENLAVLLDRAKKAERHILEATLKALALYEPDIPEDKLIALAMAPEKGQASGLAFDSPAANGRSGWAIGLLLKRGAAETLMNEYAKMTERQRRALLKVAAASESPEAMKTVLSRALDAEPPSDDSALANLSRMILSNQLTLDDATMKKIDAFIPKIRGARDRNHFQGNWKKKLAALNESDTQSEYLREKLLDALKSGENVNPKTLKALVKQGIYSRLIEIFPSLDGQVKRELLHHLPRKELDKVPDGALELAWLAVADPGESISAVALNYLADNSSPALDFLRKAWNYDSQIDNDAARKRFRDSLWSNACGKVGDMTVPEIVAVAAETPTRNFVKQAIDRLERDSDQRTENFAELAAAWPKIANEKNRRWIMEEIKNVSYLQFAFRKPEELKTFQALFDLAMADKSNAVRVAALAAAFRLERPDYPDDATAKKIIDSDLPKKMAAEIRGRHELWTCEIWRNLTRDRNLRMKALKKIVGVIEKTDNPETANIAANALDHPSPGENDYFADLTRIAKNSKFEKCRLEALSHLSAIDFTKDPDAVSAFVKALGDDDAELRYRAFMALSYKCQKYNQEFRSKHLSRLKAAAAKEPDPKTKNDMERALKHVLDVDVDDTPRQPPPKPAKPKTKKGF